MFAYPKLAQKVLRCFGTSAALGKNHYDVLEITPKATQADVKAAYYKLSMIHHPDKSKDSMGDKFRDITEAYEVLGNVKLRRMYDKGMVHISRPSPRSHETAEDPQAGFYRSREQRSRPPPPTGRTPIYDFDEWARAHYGATFARDMGIKKRREMRQRMEEQTQNENKIENVLGAMVVLLMFFMYATSEPSQDNIIFRRPSQDSVAPKVDK